MDADTHLLIYLFIDNMYVCIYWETILIGAGIIINGEPTRSRMVEVLNILAIPWLFLQPRSSWVTVPFSNLMIMTHITTSFYHQYLPWWSSSSSSLTSWHLHEKWYISRSWTDQVIYAWFWQAEGFSKQHQNSSVYVIYSKGFWYSRILKKDNVKRKKSNKKSMREKAIYYIPKRKRRRKKQGNYMRTSIVSYKII